MSAKNGGTHQGRRTPLSLNTGIPKLQSQNQKGQAAANTNGNSKNEAQQQQLNFKTKKERQQERQQERQREMANKNHENKSTENGHKANGGGEKPPKQQNGKEKFDKNAAETVAAKDKDTTKAENAVVTVIEDNDKPEKQSGEQKDKKSEESVPMPASEKIETNGGTPSKTTIPTIDLVDEDDVAMDVTEEANAKPVAGGSVTPKRATRTKTPTPKKLKADKMSMSPTVVLTRADKAAVEAANATVSTNVTEPESSAEVVNTPKTPEKQVVAEEEAAEDDLMESIQVEPSPIKSPAQEKIQAPVQQAAPSSSSSVTNPSATSTPGKYSSRFTYSLADSHVPIVGGRRSIHPINEKYIDRYQSIRESYRRINTELDVTSDTNTSMNVTVGSEIPNNSSFSSFFSRGNRKRDRTPSNLSLNEDVKRELVTSPPKRARFEGFMHLVASPITLLRSRFSRASIQNRVPTRIDAHLDQEEEEVGDNVQNLSGGDENMPPPATDNEPKDEVAAAATEENAAAHSTEESVGDITIAEEAKASETPKKDAPTTEIGAAGDAKEKTDVDITNQDGAEGAAETTATDSNSNDDDIQIVERQKKGCVIM